MSRLCTRLLPEGTKFDSLWADYYQLRQGCEHVMDVVFVSACQGSTPWALNHPANRLRAVQSLVRLQNDSAGTKCFHYEFTFTCS